MVSACAVPEQKRKSRENGGGGGGGGAVSGLEIMSYSQRKVWLKRNTHPIKPERGS